LGALDGEVVAAGSQYMKEEGERHCMEGRETGTGTGTKGGRGGG
jgi:hypothetical protein